MERVGGPQRTRLQREQEVLRSAMDVPCQLDAVVDTLIETRQNRVLKSSRRLAGERLLVYSPRRRRDDLSYGQIGNEDVLSPFDHCVELVPSGLGQVQLQQGACVAIERARQARTIGGLSLSPPR